MKDPVVSDPFLRAALTLATDKAQLVANSVGLDDPGTVTAESRVFAQGQPGQDSEPAPSFAYSPGEATTLLTSLGYVPDQNGILHLAGDGLPLTLTVTGPTNDSIIAALEQQLQAEWAAVGITLLVHNVSMGDLLGTVLPEGRYQLALAPYDLPVFPTWNAIYYTDPVLPSPLYPASLGLHGGTNKIKSPPASTAGTSWLWNIATSRGTEPGAVTSGAVTRDVTGLNGPAVYADFEQIIAQLNTDTQVLLLSKLDASVDTRPAHAPSFSGACQPCAAVRHSKRQRKPHLGRAVLERGGLGHRAGESHRVIVGRCQAAPVGSPGPASRRWGKVRDTLRARRAPVGNHVGVAE